MEAECEMTNKDTTMFVKQRQSIMAETWWIAHIKELKPSAACDGCSETC